MKQLLLPVILFFSVTAITSGANGQPKPASFEKLDSLMAVKPRNIVVSISTSWCKYCLLMRNSVYSHKKISTVLDSQFYYIELDAESKTPIRFRDQVFTNEEAVGSRGVHQLARILGTVNGTISYPTLCILNKDLEIIYQHAGLLKRDQMLHILSKAANLQAP